MVLSQSKWRTSTQNLRQIILQCLDIGHGIICTGASVTMCGNHSRWPYTWNVYKMQTSFDNKIDINGFRIYHGYPLWCRLRQIVDSEWGLHCLYHAEIYKMQVLISMWKLGQETVISIKCLRKHLSHVMLRKCRRLGGHNDSANQIIPPTLLEYGQPI